MGKLLDKLKDLAMASGADIDSTDDRLSEVIDKINVSGGSSDFSIVTITVTNTGNSNIEFFIPSIYSDEGVAGAVPDWYIAGNTSDSIPVILYKGYAMLTIPRSSVIVKNMSGNISGSDGVYYITGDCLIEMQPGGVI